MGIYLEKSTVHGKYLHFNPVLIRKNRTFALGIKSESSKINMYERIW